MIHESYYWRKELIKISDKIQKKIKVQKNWSDSKYAKLEKNLMLGFYIIRKLMEANKLTNKLGSSKFQLKEYKNSSVNITLFNNHKFYDNYDLQNHNIVKRDLKFLINQFVHSYTFAPKFEITNKNILKRLEDENLSEEEQNDIYDNSEKELIGILINTDSNKNTSLFEIDIKSIIDIFTKIGECNVTHIEMKFNPKKGDYDTFQSDEEIEMSEEMRLFIEKSEKQ